MLKIFVNEELDDIPESILEEANKQNIYLDNYKYVVICDEYTPEEEAVNIVERLTSDSNTFITLDNGSLIYMIE